MGGASRLFNAIDRPVIGIKTGELLLTL